MKEFFYIVITLILVLIYPIAQKRIKDERVQSILFKIYIPFAILYVVVVAYFIIVGKQIEDKVVSLEDKPGFHEEMWSMITGIPAEAVNELHKASDAYDVHDYETAFKYARKGISILEKEKDRDLTKYSGSQYRQKAGWMYQLAAKAAGRFNQRILAYQYAKKAVDFFPSSYNHYVLAVAAYNVKKYQEAKENTDSALEKGPSQSIRGQLTEIRKRTLAHLEKQ